MAVVPWLVPQRPPVFVEAAVSVLHAFYHGKETHMERLGRQKKTYEINGNALRAFGLLFLAAGVISRGIIQNHILGLGNATGAQMIEIMGASEANMTMVTVALILQATETCAVPIFALMVVEGFCHTSDFKAYMVRVLKLGVLAEIPYNLLMGSPLNTRNPVFGVAFALLLLYFYQTYAQKGMKNTLIKAVVTVAAVVWCEMLSIEFGAALVLVTAGFWPRREKPMYRNLMGATMSFVCTVISPFFMASPMSFLLIHFYNGEKSTNSRKLNYLAYPVMLLAAAAAGLVL